MMRAAAGHEPRRQFTKNNGEAVPKSRTRRSIRLRSKAAARIAVAFSARGQRSDATKSVFLSTLTVLLRRARSCALTHNFCSKGECLFFAMAASLLLAHPAAAAEHSRIVSLDYCADQYVLKFIPRARIAALSIDAEKSFSYMRREAAGLKKTRAAAENVLVLKPDLIVRSYGGGPNAAAFFARAGVPVVQLGYASSLEETKAAILAAADALGASEAGRAVVEDMETRLAAIAPPADDPARVLYLSSGGATTGPGSLIHEVVEAAGFRNFVETPGWRALPLEALAYEKPDLVATAFYEEGAHALDRANPAAHDFARALLRETPRVDLKGAWTACPGWFVVDAVEALAAAREGGS